MCGRKDLVDAAFTQGFIGFETEERRTVGRPMKVDRQEVIAVTAALKEWFEMDHDARFADHRRKADELFRKLEGVSDIEVEHATERRGLGSGLLIRFDENAVGKTPVAGPGRIEGRTAGHRSRGQRKRAPRVGAHVDGRRPGRRRPAPAKGPGSGVNGIGAAAVPDSRSLIK